MKNGKKRLLIVVMLMLTMISMSACATFDSFKNTFLTEDKGNSVDNVIRIGVFEPETGRYSDKGISEIKGIELANSIYHSVNGYRVELIKVDTQSSTAAAETAIQGLIEMKPLAIIGSAGEATTLIASSYVDKAKIPAITPSATNPLITQNYRYYFRASMTSSQMGEGIADFAYHYRNSRHIGIITTANDTAATALIDGLNDKIKSYVKKDDLEDNPVVMNTASEFGDKDISAIIKMIEKKKVDTLVAPIGTETMDAFFTAIEKANLTNIEFIGTKAWGNEDFISMMKKHPGIRIAFPYPSVLGNTAEITKEAERFEIEYANKYGSDDIPTENAALGYDSYLLLINAIHNAKDLNGSDVREALLQLKDVKCATGSFTFDEKGNTVRGVNISTIKGDKVESIYVTHTTQAEDIEGLEQ